MICPLLLFELPCSAEHVLLPVPPFVARQARPLSIEALAALGLVLDALALPTVRRAVHTCTMYGLGSNCGD